jgi:hypothetical protein
MSNRYKQEPDIAVSESRSAPWRNARHRRILNFRSAR